MNTLSGIIAIHALFATTGLIVGTLLFFQKRHTYTHYIGYIWRWSMYLTAFSGLMLQSDGIGWLHIFSIVTIFFITRWIYFGTQKKRLQHNSDMLWTYIGLTIAFLFTLLPNRALWQRLYEWLHLPESLHMTVFYVIATAWGIYALFLLRKLYRWEVKIRAQKRASINKNIS